MIRLFARLLFIALLGGATALVQLASAPGAAPKRIAVLSLHNERAFTTAAAAFPGVLAVDYFATDGAGLAPAQQLDFRRYDLVFVEGGGNQFLYLLDTIERAKRETKVFVFNTTLATGNLPAAEHPAVARYWENISPENARGLLAYLGARFLGLPLEVPAPVEFLDQAFYHPDAPRAFATTDEFLAWYRATDAARPHRVYDPARPSLALIFHRQDYTKRNLAVIDALVREVERQGANAFPLMAKGGVNFSPLLGADGRPLVDAAILAVLRLNYFDYAAGLAQARALGVPLLWAPHHWRLTAEAFAADAGGLAPALTSQAIFAERDGLIEPIVVSARRAADGPNDDDKTPLPAQIRWRVSRALAWAALRRLPNAEKNLVLTFHSEGGGKSGAGSDPDNYLDAQASIAKLLPALRAAGYDVGSGPLPDRDTLAHAMAERIGNVGNWAPAELARRVAAGDAVTIPEETYLAWFRSLPPARQQEVEQVWGPPPGKIMVVADERGRRQLVLPRLQFGRFSLMPHPDWGYLQDTAVLTSRGALPPHHQYIAFFLWMQREARAHAWISLFTNLSLMPGKMEGPAADEWPSLLVGDIPNLSPTPLQANGGVGNKRRTQAVAIGFMPHIVPAALYGDALELSARLARWRSQSDGAVRDETGRGLRDEAVRLKLATVLGLDPASAPLPRLADELDRYLAELRREHMTSGTHIFGEAPPENVVAEIATSMVGAPLRDALAKTAAAADPDQPLALVRATLAAGATTDAAQTRVLGRVHAELTPLLAQAQDYAARLRACPNELTALLDALSGRYLAPGPIDDPIRNPDSLPSGRVTYQFDPAAMPSREAWTVGVKLADDLLAQYRAKHGDWPQKVGFVLWSGESALNHGVNEAQILHLLGVRPVWNQRGAVIDVALVPAAELGRPRIDVFVTTSGTYRDHFLEKIRLIDKAVRLAAAQREADNRVAAQAALIRAAVLASGVDAAQADQLAGARVYSEAPGAYSPSVQFLAESGDGWTGGAKQMAELYSSRLAHTYGEKGGGEFNRAAFDANLRGVEAASFSRSSNVYGLLDHPMVAAYFGGLALAVREQTGRATELFIADVRAADSQRTETLDRTLSRELRSRYFNPEWIRRMMAQGYDGARYMEGLAKNLSLWEATTPDLVTEEHWREIHDTYVNDKLKLGLDAYFAQHNPHARQALLATLLENAERGAWHPSAEERAQLTQKFAESVVAHGPACEAGICRNRALTDAVAAALQAAPGTAPLAGRFQAALAAMTAPATPPPAGTAEPNAAARPSAAAPANAPAPSASATAASPEVTGRVMETKTPSVPPPPSVSPRTLLVIAALAFALFAAGWWRGARAHDS